MKILAAFMLTIAIAGGGVAAYYFIVPPAVAKPQPVSTHHCIDRVMYVQFSGGATVKYRPDGKIWTCGGS